MSLSPLHPTIGNCSSLDLPFSRLSICSLVNDVRFRCNFRLRRKRSWLSSSPDELPPLSELPSDVLSCELASDGVWFKPSMVNRSILGQMETERKTMISLMILRTAFRWDFCCCFWVCATNIVYESGPCIVRATRQYCDDAMFVRCRIDQHQFKRTQRHLYILNKLICLHPACVGQTNIAQNVTTSPGGAGIYAVRMAKSVAHVHRPRCQAIIRGMESYRWKIPNKQHLLATKMAQPAHSNWIF